ncbi:neutral/alkaline non-lysosomal ceramidase N-terminal domain-containing protein [Natronoglomus mannanivorans]|uniref:Neutral/alkaline non-lysosomal ceramidase N-terminal domain-containing protein n=1 Tax=Natronoglomus mannanivorans TaxID=2979990 RepID=A0AAP2Z150_9EURY|nr:neutral/alkaline non-lysosomal ceramidase N-terminal domain-containing protein [Halobacteria archaeon AArc-xg1-1]
MIHDHEARLRTGTASVDITPGDPVEMSGYGAREGRSSGVHDPLFATALVLEDGAVTVALVSVDLLNVSRELTRTVERMLAADGVDLDELLLVATHTHAGPYVPARALDISPPLRAETDVSETVAEITEGIVEAVGRAADRIEPATIRVGNAREDGVQQNRRAAGGVGGNVRVPHGPVDPDVTALLVETESGTETVVYNFACHPVCTTGDETLLSADWPGYTREHVEAERDGATVLFLNGAAGDINPRGMDPDRSGEDVYDLMDRVGTRVGDAVCRALEDAESSTKLERAPVRLDAVDVRFPLKETPSAETIRGHVADLEERLAALEERGDEVGYEKLNWDRRYAEELLAIAEWDARCLPNRIPYVEIGELGIVGLPGEVLARHGLEFRARANAETLVLAGYATDYVGYVPRLADLENVGYEVRTMKLAPEAIVEFRESVLELVGGSM